MPERALGFAPGTLIRAGAMVQACLLRVGEIGPSRTVSDKDTLRRAKLAPNAKLVAVDGTTMGRIVAVRYHATNESLVAHLVLDPPLDEEALVKLCAVAELKATGVGCAICRRFLRAGDLPCACIYHSPSLLVKEIVIERVLLYAVSDDSEICDHCRRHLLDQHFPHIVDSITVALPPPPR